jgi:hypothetical protein
MENLNHLIPEADLLSKSLVAAFVVFVLTLHGIQVTEDPQTGFSLGFMAQVPNGQNLIVQFISSEVFKTTLSKWQEFYSYLKADYFQSESKCFQPFWFALLSSIGKAGCP